MTDVTISTNDLIELSDKLSNGRTALYALELAIADIADNDDRRDALGMLVRQVDDKLKAVVLKLDELRKPAVPEPSTEEPAPPLP